MDRTKYVEAFRTPESREEVWAAVLRAYVDRSPEPTVRAGRLLLAQVEHEGYKWARNIGGIKRSGDGLFCALGTHEVLDAELADKLIAAGKATAPKFYHHEPPGKKAVYFPNQGPNGPAATFFAAFLSIDDSARHFVTKIFDRFRAGPALATGDPAAYAAWLKKGYYFSASLPSYTSALAAQLARVPADLELPPETFGERFVDHLVWPEDALSVNYTKPPTPRWCRGLLSSRRTEHS